MKIIIHGGTHKTGSTTIQYIFSQLQQELYRYAPTWSLLGPGRANHHNNIFALCFAGRDEQLHLDPMFHDSGKTRAQLLALREQQLATLTAALAGNTKPACLFSLEALTMSKRSWVQNFAEYCQRFTAEVQVIVYVRAPVAYMQSLFAQQARVLPDLRPTPLLAWPNYRQQLEPLLEAFGPARVHFKFYHRDWLVGGDVALDFAAEIGVPLSPAQVVQKNEGLSLEATALLYTFKTLLPPRMPSLRQERQRRRFASRLSTLGSAKLQLAPALVAPLLNQHRADLDWVAQQLGTRIEDLPTDPANQLDSVPAAAGSPTVAPTSHSAGTGSPTVAPTSHSAGTGNPTVAPTSHSAAATPISSLQDLHEIALTQTEAVEELAGLTAPTGSSRQQRLLFALCALYDRE